MKKILLFTFLVSALASFGQGLISSYPFNGNANDENGTNNGAVYGATLTIDRFGNPNSAYSFDGVDDYIQIEHNPTLNLTDSVTFSLWFKPTDTAVLSSQRFLDKSTWNTSDSWGIGLSTNRSYITLAGLTTDPLLTNPVLTTSSWYHLVATYDKQNVKFYINGVLDTVRSVSTSTPSNTNPVRIGANSILSNNWFDGKLDDIKIYDKALTQSEVDNLYNEGVCYQTVTVTDTLVINYTITGYNPIEYANTIKVYPNPTSNLITIDSDNNSFGHTLKIINSASQEVYIGTINSNQETLDLSTWTGAGIYFLHLYDDKGNLIDIKKIVLR